MRDVDEILEARKALDKLDVRIAELESIKGLDGDYKNMDSLQVEIGARIKAVEILKKVRVDLRSAIN